jgi:hypothetical protein
MITASAVALPAEQLQPFYDLQLNKPVNKSELLNALQNFLLIDETIAVIPPPLAEISPVLIEKNLSQEKLQALENLLKANYQATIARLNDSEALQIDAIITIGEELLELAEKYHYQPLYEWADRLKSQAELFDLVNLPKTLSDFQSLLTRLA